MAGIAGDISRHVRQYLNDPDLMLRRFRYKIKETEVKDDEGNVIGKEIVWGKKWKKAYRDDEGRLRFKDYDKDDCPKIFKFEGWHPQCFCFVTPILVDEDEMAKMTEAALNGEEYKPQGEAVYDYPQAYKDWVKDNADTIEQRWSEGKMNPYFIEHNKEVYGKIIKGYDFSNDIKDPSVDYIANTLDRIKNLSPKQMTFCSFEPFSPIIAQMYQNLKTAREKERLFESVFNHSSMVADTKEPNVVIHSKHKTNGNWEQAKDMARHIVKNQKNKVAFLPESDSVTNADAIVLVDGKWRIADFKYCISTKANTIQIDLSKAFEQGDMAVIQLAKADSSKLIEAINYIKRNDLPLGEILVLNKMGDYIHITKRDLRYNRHNKKIRGFL
ncbi:MAG: hypothetical protein LIP09_07585 [Bacteroidales bacterium]|nr:hypothetical protein [Bacteroidales bacterium]